MAVVFAFAAFAAAWHYGARAESLMSGKPSTAKAIESSMCTLLAIAFVLVAAFGSLALLILDLGV